MASSPPGTPAVCTECAQLLKVGHVVNNSLTYLPEHPSLGNLQNKIYSVDSPVTIIVARVQKYRKNKDGKNVSKKKCNCFNQLKTTFNQIFRMPRLWWSDWCRRSGGYFGSGDTFDDDAKLDGHNSWFRCDVKQIRGDLVSEIDKAGGKDYTWWKINAFVRWDAKTRRSLVVILDPIAVVEQELLHKEDGIMQLLDARSLSMMRTANSPYFIPSLFMEAAVHFHNKAVMGTRDLVRDIELEHERKEPNDPWTSRLHPGLRHVIHVTEMLETMLTITTEMLNAHSLFVDENLVSAKKDEDEELQGALNSRVADVLNRQVVFRIHDATVALRTLYHRAQSNSSRLHNEVTLSSAVLSANIAKAAQIDNSIMKTLGQLGTAFLPATFIAALFSMSFFGTDNNNNWVWHPQIWYFFVITPPITAAVMFWTWSAHPRLKEKRAEEARVKREAKRIAEEQRKKEAQAAATAASESNLRSPLSPWLRNRGRTFSGGSISHFNPFHRRSTQPAGMAVPPVIPEPPHELASRVAPRSPPTSPTSARAAMAGSAGLGISGSAEPMPRGDQAV